MNSINSRSNSPQNHNIGMGMGTGTHTRYQEYNIGGISMGSIVVMGVWVDFMLRRLALAIILVVVPIILILIC